MSSGGFLFANRPYLVRAAVQLGAKSRRQTPHVQSLKNL
jgi:hypothetical protein